ncbi:MAG: YggT family protein [Candidatus Omnitrophica bacterium]|nr:YggT family protein [Candidatus Omnitrophota bacterium]
MFIISNFLLGLARVLNVGLTIIWWLVFIRAIISWVNPDPFNPIVQFLYRSTEPILSPLRRIIPPTFGIDISPLIAFLIIVFLRPFLVNTLIGLALRMQ